MSFKDMVAADNEIVFLDLDAFGEEHTIKYDGNTYKEVPCLITKLKEKDRTTPKSDHTQGLYLVTSVLHCRLAAIGGILPERGKKFYVNDGSFMQEYFVGQSGCSMGMVRLELEAIDE